MSVGLDFDLTPGRPFPSPHPSPDHLKEEDLSTSSKILSSLSSAITGHPLLTGDLEHVAMEVNAVSRLVSGGGFRASGRGEWRRGFSARRNRSFRGMGGIGGLYPQKGEEPLTCFPFRCDPGGLRQDVGWLSKCRWSVSTRSPRMLTLTRIRRNLAPTLAGTYSGGTYSGVHLPTTLMAARRVSSNNWKCPTTCSPAKTG
jgi:hypothetical protein